MQASKISLPCKYRHLNKFFIAYVIAIILSNFFDSWQINFLGLHTGVGSIIFPMTYLIANCITEIYDYNKTITAIWIGFGCYIFTFLSVHLFTMFWTPLTNVPFGNGFLDRNNQILIASILSILFTETFNAALLSRLKIKLKDEYVYIRFFISTVLAYLINELIYAPVAYHGILNGNELIYHILSSWLFMSAIEIIMLRFFVKLAMRVKSLEQLDTYNHKTSYNVFKLHSRYKNSSSSY